MTTPAHASDTVAGGADAGSVPGVVIIGAGHSGVQLADSLRQSGYAKPVALIEQQLALPYQRPPLSKDLLTDPADSPEVLPLRGIQFYRDADIDLVQGCPAVAVDRSTRTVELSDGRGIEYEHLVFATGARARALDVEGSNLRGVVELRTHDDALRLREALDASTSVVIIGAGFIGLEVAAAARKLGKPVTVVERGDRPLGRAASPALSHWFVGALAGEGIELVCEAGVANLCASAESAGNAGNAGDAGHVAAVTLDDGRQFDADLVIVGVGVLPESELAAECGLDVDNGIIVDDRLSTSDPSISAIGDCARFPLPADGDSARIGSDSAGTARVGSTRVESVRLESVQNATDQARHLAARISGAASGAYSEVPWFWSHQGPFRLTIAGLARPGFETLIRGDVDSARFSIFGFNGDELRVVESVNAQADHRAARRVLASGRTPTRQQIADPDFDFKAFSLAP